MSVNGVTDGAISKASYTPVLSLACKKGTGRTSGRQMLGSGWRWEDDGERWVEVIVRGGGGNRRDASGGGGDGERRGWRRWWEVGVGIGGVGVGVEVMVRGGGGKRWGWRWCTLYMHCSKHYTITEPHQSELVLMCMAQ